MSRRKTRNLRPEEEALWQSVAAKARPMHPRRATLAKPAKPPVSVSKPEPPRDPLPPLEIGAKARPASARHDLAGSVSDRIAAQPLAMDRKSFGKMKRGKLQPDARLDLHGMTLAEAHPALISFILSSQAAGHRLVLVITGKGKRRDDNGPIPERRGLLRHQVPNWLSSGPLKPAVLQVAQAHLKHGGEGAYYVYLRRRR